MVVLVATSHALVPLAEVAGDCSVLPVHDLAMGALHEKAIAALLAQVNFDCYAPKIQRAILAVSQSLNWAGNQNGNLAEGLHVHWAMVKDSQC